MNSRKNPLKSSDSLYLEKLKFRPELRKTWLNFFVTNFRVVLLLIFLISIWGIYAYLNLPRESNPEVEIPIAVVITPYPGASPRDVEELVTKKLEAGISGIKGIDKLTSVSRNSLSQITVEFEASEDLEDALRRLRDEVTSLENELPTDASDPLVREISVDDTPVWTIAMHGPYDGLTLRKIAEDIQDELEKIIGVREVTVSGGDELEFEVAYDPEKLATYDISIDLANQAIAATNRAFPAGNFEGAKYTYPVRTDSRIFSAAELGNVAVGHSENGGIILLRDIAAVSERAIEKTLYARLSLEGTPPQDSVTIGIVKKTGGSVLTTVDEAQASVDRIIAAYPGVQYDATLDFAKEIRRDFDQLKHDFLLTVLLVSTILFLMVGAKEALVAGLAIPLVFGVTFGVMMLTGISLNFLSNLSLLLALGLLVDDAIVVVSATKQYLKTGKFTPEEAVLLVLNDFKVVLTTTTLTTVWAFLPLLMSTGIIGEYIKSIPITVSVTLISSLFIALMINHPLAAVLERVRLTRKLFWLLVSGLFGTGLILLLGGSFLGILFALPLILWAGWLIRWYRKSGKNELRENEIRMEQEWEDDALIKKKLAEQGSHEDSSVTGRLLHGILNFQYVLPTYEKYLRPVISNRRNRWKLLGGTLALFLIVMTFPIFGIVPTAFFPSQDSEYVFVNVEGPIGLKLEETDRIVREVEERLLKYPEIVNFSTVVGISSNLNDISGIGTSSSHLASVTVKLQPNDEREATSYDLAATIRQDLNDFTEAQVTVEALGGGPPVGAAFEARISGEDLTVLDRIAADLLPFLAAIPGVINPEVSLKEAPAEYTFLLDPVRLELYDLNALMVGAVLRTAISGTEVSTVLREGEEYEIIARFDKRKIPTLESIQNLQVLNRRGEPVFLKDVAKIELQPAVDAITRIDQKRTVLLSAGVEGETTGNEVLAEFQSKVNAEYDFPEGYEIAYGGENEQNIESVNSILRAMLIAAFLIVSTLIIQFNSFKKAFIVLISFPLALIGVFIGLAIFRIPLSFPGLIGVLALFGIVVKNAIILIDKINLNIKFGIPFEEAIIDAGKARFEAILITSICTIFGLIPVTLSNEAWTALGSAVIFGLTLSSFLTLFVVPTLFRTMIGEKERF